MIACGSFGHASIKAAKSASLGSTPALLCPAVQTGASLIASSFGPGTYPRFTAGMGSIRPKRCSFESDAEPFTLHLATTLKSTLGDKHLIGNCSAFAISSRARNSQLVE